MGDVTITTAELRELRREVQETKWLAFAALAARVGRERADKQLLSIQGFVRWGSGTGTPIDEVVGNATPAFLDLGLYTLEEVAVMPRREVAALRGVGRVTLTRVDASIEEHGLSWAEVA